MQALIEVGVGNALVAGVFACAIVLASRVWRNPHVLHLLWLLVLVKLVVPPVFEVSLPLVDSRRLEAKAAGYQVSHTQVIGDDVGAFSSGDASTDHANTKSAPRRPQVRFDDVRPHWSRASIAAILFGAWAFGATWLMAVTAWRLLRFHRLVRGTLPAPEMLQRQAASVAERLGLSVAPQIKLVDGTVPPMVWAGGRRPCVLLPCGLVRDLKDDSLPALLAHELAHIRRRDHWVRWFETVVIIVHWWNPVAWWARRELHQNEEHCCDALVLRAFPEKAEGYADALLLTIEFLSGHRPIPAPLASTFGGTGHLRRRCEMVVRGDVGPVTSWRMVAAAVLGAAVVLPWSGRFMLAEEPIDSDDAVVVNGEARDYVSERSTVNAPELGYLPLRTRLSTQIGELEIRRFDPAVNYRLGKVARVSPELELRVTSEMATVSFGEYRIEISTGYRPSIAADAHGSYAYQSALAGLISRRVSAEVDLKVMEARLQAYEDMPVAEVAPSEGEVREAIESAPEMVALRESIAGLRQKMEDYVGSMRGAEKTNTYRAYQDLLREHEERVGKSRAAVRKSLQAAALSEAEEKRSSQTQELRREIAVMRTTVATLEQQYEKELHDASTIAENSLDLEFVRSELDREERVFGLIADRILALRTELNPGDAELKKVIGQLIQERDGRRQRLERLREHVRSSAKQLAGRDPFNLGGRQNRNAPAVSPAVVQMKDQSVSVTRQGVIVLEIVAQTKDSDSEEGFTPTPRP